jgi:hypothetical protein
MYGQKSLKVGSLYRLFDIMPAIRRKPLFGAALLNTESSETLEQRTLLPFLLFFSFAEQSFFPLVIFVGND